MYREFSRARSKNIFPPPALCTCMQSACAIDLRLRFIFLRETGNAMPHIGGFSLLFSCPGKKSFDRTVQTDPPARQGLQNVTRKNA